LSVEIYEKYQSSRLRLIFRGSFEFVPSKLTKYANGNYIMLNLKEDTAKLYIVGKKKTNGIRIHLSSK
jgi:hypothetical protein